MKRVFFVIIFLFMMLFDGVFAKMSNTINVAYTIDNNYPLFALLSINSAIINNTSSSDLHFFIIENNITDKNKKIMKNFVEKRGQHIDFIHIDTSVIDQGKNYYVNIERITRIGMSRIILPDLLPKDIHRVIYLDADTLVNTDLDSFYNYNLGNYSTGMACDVSTYVNETKKFPRIEKRGNCKIVNFEERDNYNTIYKFKNGYYNSGVILMDLDKWRRRGISRRMLTFLHNHEKNFAGKKKKGQTIFLFGDQDLINIVLDKKIKTIDQRWNNQSLGNFSMVSMDNSILHYVGIQKPWMYFFTLSKPIRLYFSYWVKSPLVVYRPYYMYVACKWNYNYIMHDKMQRFISAINTLDSLWQHKFFWKQYKF